MARLLVEHLAKTYPTRSRPLEVLRDVSFTLDEGQNLAVLGPSGSGKSTLLGILAALDRASGGRVLLDGQDPVTLDEPQLAAFRGRRIGLVFQDHYLLPQCSLLENVLVPAVALGPVRRASIDRARDLLGRVGLADRLDHRPAELSGGERQRAAVARALINAPVLVLADEPTGELDHANADRVGRLLVDLQRHQPMMLVVATHSERLAALMSRRFELDDGMLKEIA